MACGVPVVADLSAGDAEMHRVIKETVNALGGLDIIVNRHIANHTFCSNSALCSHVQIAVQAQQQHAQCCA